MFSTISKIVRKLPIFNPFNGCLETFEPLPNLIPAVPTVLVEAVWDKWIIPITLIMVAIIFDYIRGENKELGALGFFILWAANNLFVKGLVWSAGSWIGFVFFVGLYIMILAKLYSWFHDYEIASSAPIPPPHTR